MDEGHTPPRFIHYCFSGGVTSTNLGSECSTCGVHWEVDAWAAAYQNLGENIRLR